MLDFADFCVPYLDRSVSRARHKVLAILGPRDTKDAAVVSFGAVNDLVFHSASLAIVQIDFLVSADADKIGAVGREANGVDEVGMIASARNITELEGRALIEDEVLVISSRGSSDRPLLSYAYGVDLGRVAADLTHCVA